MWIESALCFDLSIHANTCETAEDEFDISDNKWQVVIKMFTVDVAKMVMYGIHLLHWMTSRLHVMSLNEFCSVLHKEYLTFH